MILEFQEEPDLVHLEVQSTGLFLEEPVDLSAYRLVLSDILASALGSDDSIELLREAVTTS